MHVKEMGLEGMDGIDLAQDRGCCESCNERSGSIKCVEFLDYPSRY